MRSDLPLNGVVGQGRSLNANSGECLNCYIEQTAAGDAILIGTPGMNNLLTLPNASIRGCYSDSNISYWVAGNGVYKVTSALTYTFLGSIGTYNGFVDFASSGIDLMLVDGASGWSIKLATGVLTQITDPDFPANPTTVNYINGYFAVTIKNSQQFYVSEKLNIATVWNALDFASAEGNPDAVMGSAVYQNELILLGFKTVEVWGFTGNVDFPFQRNGNAIVDQGCIAPWTARNANNSLYWLGGDSLGQGIVWRMNGYTPERISNHECEQRLAALSLLNDAYALTYQQEGHIFYVLQFPSANHTEVFDTTTGLWHTRSYRNPLTGDYNYWRAAAICFSGSRVLAGDIQNGNIYELDLDYYTDDGAPIVRQRETTAMQQAQANLFYQELIVHMETGVGLNDGFGDNAELELQWSNDGGHTWSNWRRSTLGRIGQYGARAKYNRLGVGRNRVWRIRMTAPVKFVMLGAVLEVEQGSS